MGNYYILMKYNGCEGYEPPIAFYYSKTEALKQRDFIHKHGFTSGFQVWELGIGKEPKPVDWDEE